MRRVVTSAVLFAFSGLADASGLPDPLPAQAGDAIVRSVGTGSNRGLRILLPGWHQRYQEGIWRITTPHAGAHLARWRLGVGDLETGITRLGAGDAVDVLPGFTPVAQVPMTLGDGRACRVIGRCRPQDGSGVAPSGIAVVFHQQGVLQALATRGGDSDLTARLRDLLVATTLV